MKKIIFFSILVCITLSGFSQRKIKKVEVQEIGYKVTLVYKPILDEISQDGLKIKITPISPEELNSEFLRESSFNGKFNYSNYEKSRISYFMKRKRTINQKTDYEFLQEGAFWLMDNEIINEEEYDELIKRIVFYYDENEGEKIYNYDYNTSSNPYYNDVKYLNVFKIEFLNTTNSIKTFGINLILESGNQIQHPLSEETITQWFYTNNHSTDKKIENIKRHNLPQSLFLPANSKIEKYFAVFPINFRNNILQISLLGNDSKFKWDIVKNENIIDEKFTFYELKLGYTYDNTSSDDGLNFNLLKGPESSIFVKDKAVFIDDNHLADKFEIFNFSIYGDNLYYGRQILTGSDFVDLSKNRRSTLTIATTKITEVKRKIKP